MVPALRPNVVSDPLRGGPGSVLRGSPGEVGEAGLPPGLVLDIKGSASGCLLGHLVRPLVTRDPRVGRNPVDGHIIAAGHQARGDLDDRPSPALAWAQGFGPCSLNGWLAVRENREPLPGPVSRLEGLEGLVDGMVRSLFVFLYFYPLHAARRAMAAACRCLGNSGGLFYVTRSGPKPLRVNLGLPNLLLPARRTKERTKEGKRDKGRKRRKIQPRGGPAPPLLFLPRKPGLPPPSALSLLPLSCTPPSCSPEPQNRLNCPDIPQNPSRWRPRALPLAVLAHSLPQPSYLRYPRLALDKQIVTRLSPTTVAPLALICAPVIRSCRRKTMAACSDRSW